MQAYTITINLPTELQSQLHDITDEYLKLIKDYTYIQSYEDCKDGKEHCHIGYLAPPQKSTSNETRKFNGCYTFSKREYPNAIKHKQHTSWSILAGYISKSNTNDHINTTLSTDSLDKYRNEYDKMNVKKKDKDTFMTLNQIYKDFSKYYAEQDYNVLKNPENGYHIIHCYMASIKEHILGTTYQRLNKDKLLEFAKFQYTPNKKYFI